MGTELTKQFLKNNGFYSVYENTDDVWRYRTRFTPAEAAICHEPECVDEIKDDITIDFTHPTIDYAEHWYITNGGTMRNKFEGRVDTIEQLKAVALACGCEIKWKD